MFANHWANLKGITTIVVLLSVICPTAMPQANDQKKKVFSLEEAVDFALKNHPSVRASLERVSAAQGGVTLARTNYLPRTDTVWQTNRGTDNNITGLLLPQSVIAPISGPVPLSTSNRSAWGSAAGLLFSWQAYDFGHRRATVAAAHVTQNRTSAEASLTRLDVAVATVNAYLTLLAAEQSVRATKSDVERREIFAKAVHVLVDNQLRAGADASRADAELARARANAARAQQQEAVSRAALADILGTLDFAVEVQEPALLGAAPAASPPPAAVSAHPFAEVQQSRVEESHAQSQILDRAYYPKLYVQSAVYGRGSGLDPAGNFLGGSKGLGPDRPNWAVGVTATFGAFDIFAIRARKAIETANERAEKACYDQALLDLSGQLRKAQASLDGARQVAEYTPLELEAARTTENQQMARYQAGLATLVEVSDAQSLRVQSEIDDALAKLAVWQNLAAVAASQGEIQPFLKSVREKTQGGP